MAIRDIEVLEHLLRQGVSRRTFLQYCTTLAALMALPPSAGRVFAKSLASALLPSVIWLSFQGCAGCCVSITRAHHQMNVPVVGLTELIADHLAGTHVE